MAKISRWIFAALWLVLWAALLGLDLGEPALRVRGVAIPNVALIGLLGLIMTLGLAIWQRAPHRALPGKKSNFVRGLLVASALLFVVQFWLALGLYCFGQWDAGIIDKIAIEYAGDYAGALNGYHFDRYPNNLPIVGLLALLVRVTRWLGVYGYYGCLAAGCGLVNLAGACLALLVRRLTGKDGLAWLAWAVFVPLVGLSPWLGIPYTDTFSILFPVLALLLFSAPGGRWWWKWFGACIMCCLGALIKPQVLVMLVALVLAAMGYWRPTKANVKRCLAAGLILATVGLGALGIQVAMPAWLGYEANPDNAFTATHFFMMGLNEKGRGGYAHEDVEFSKRASNRAERQAGDIAVARQRLADFGPGGYASFLFRKLLYNYNDGTFAWSREGRFFWEVPPPSVPGTAGLRAFFYSNTDTYGVFPYIAQCLWLLVLALLTGLALPDGGDQHRAVAATALRFGLLGITAFTLLFEARARYLFCYVPLYIAGAAMGLARIRVRWAECGAAKRLSKEVN